LDGIGFKSIVIDFVHLTLMFIVRFEFATEVFGSMTLTIRVKLPTNIGSVELIRIEYVPF
jgi:hypothetical protein